MGGKLVKTKEIFLNGQIRSGRTSKVKKQLILGLRKILIKNTNLKKNYVWVYLEDLLPNQMIEYGEVLPKSGTKKKWFNSLTLSLRKRLKKMEKKIMKIEGKSYKTIWFENNSVKIIDQTKLPHQFVIKDLKTVKDSINAIKTMEVRGAPLIGATAAYGLVLSIIENNDLSFLKKSSEDLIASRPTAINLKWAVDRMMKKLIGVNDKDILKIALDEAKAIKEEDEGFCKNIGLNGLKIMRNF